MDGAMDGRIRQLLENYLDELYLWAPRLNLTTVPRDQAWRRHIEESLRLLTVARPQLGSRLCDLGSGAGLPGLPMAIARPDVHVVLCDSDSRRCAFLRHVTALLPLENTTVTADRAERLGRAVESRESFDVVVSRALASPAVLCELALPLVRVGGRLCALVGDAAEASATARVAATECGGGPPHTVGPGVMVVEKLAPTPERFPRRVGVPSKRPLV